MSLETEKDRVQHLQNEDPMSLWRSRKNKGTDQPRETTKRAKIAYILILDFQLREPQEINAAALLWWPQETKMAS